MTTKYKLLKPLSGKSIIENNGCEDETIKFINKFGIKNEIKWTKEIEDYCSERNGWIRFFVKCEFIEENKIKFDKLKFYFVKDYQGDVCRLCFDKRIGDDYRWIVVNENVAYTTRNTFEEAIEYFKTAQQKHQYYDFEIKAFDTISEATEYYSAYENKETTVEQDLNTIYKLDQKHNFGLVCSDFSDDCDDNCSKCPYDE